MSVIKDVLLKLQLSLAFCRGQCYDSASNMLGHKTGVAKRIQDVQSKAHSTYCHGHSLSLRVKGTVKNCKLLLNTMDRQQKKSQPSKNVLPNGNIYCGRKSMNNLQPEAVISLCPTGWTVRASCFHRIIHNYSALLQEWIVYLNEKL